MDCEELRARLDEELGTERYADLDASANGLQVGPGDVSIDHVAFAVDAAVATIESAVEAGADLLVTHHGVSWGGIERLTGSHYRRIAPLIEGDLALYVSHLPLDGHQSLGNAAGIADLLGLVDRRPFGELGGEHVGQRGVMDEATTIDGLQERLQSALDTGGRDVQVLDFGPPSVREVAIVTGSGVDWLAEAVTGGADVLITGEGKGKAYHEAREAGIHVVLGGHYATETFGVQSLESLVSDLGLQTTYLDCPTGL